MMKLHYAIPFLLISAPVFAQQPPQQSSPSQLAIQIDNVVNGWAAMIEQQQTQIQQLQIQLAQEKAKNAPVPAPTPTPEAK